MSYDLVTVGEAMLRFWVNPGSRLEDAPTFRVGVAGAEANVAIAVARMGYTSAFISRLPRSALGRRAAREIELHGVDTRHIAWIDGARLGSYFVELASPPRPSRVIYDRAGSAAAAMDESDIDWSALTTGRIVHLTGITPALSESCRRLMFMVVEQAKHAGCLVTLDLNYRRSLWAPERAREVLEHLCPSVDLVIGAERDLASVFGITGEPRKVLRAAMKILQVASVIVTRGGNGCAWSVQGREGETPAFKVDVVDRVGAGDAFAAGVIVGLLRDNVECGIQYGTAMAALTLGWNGDQFWGDQSMVEEFLARGANDILR